MTLKSIELVGFKSFGKKTLLSFNTPITSIVGPNGSGKSNIVESIRFVLGEQSMKSLRGKGGSDLIFKGSKNLSSSSRASVTITFDNSKKIFSFSNSGLGVSLDYDEVIISREVFADGSNKYSINNTEVRLKDVIDLLASVNIGSSGHHIISQGEADRILNASNKDRKAMVEDALGLRVYQYRIREAERKLERTVNNMKEVSSLRREIAPHLNFLKKQVQAVEKAKNMREELNNLYKIYLAKESTYIKNESKRLELIKTNLSEKEKVLDEKINQIKDTQKEEVSESEHTKEIQENESKLSFLRKEKDELARALGRIEGILESLKNQIETNPKATEKVISASEWESATKDIEDSIDKALELNDLPKVINILNEIKNRIVSLRSGGKAEQIQKDPELEDKFNEMKLEKENIDSKIVSLNKEENEILDTIRGLRSKEESRQEYLRDNERVLYELLNNKNKISSELHTISFSEDKLKLIKESFDSELVEASVLVGREILNYAKSFLEEEIKRNEQEELRRKIERIKIKLEDTGSGSGADIIKEYEETKERDEFLEKELEDIKISINSLEELIKDLKESLDKEFKEGIKKINSQFQDFFALMFGGGKAYLSITMEYKKTKKEENIDDSEINLDDEKNELGFEKGIEIDVSLPHKKVKDLNMLSGGERSLTSIALLFAISQVNPPPFLVLDETDAALDESNSRKYGDMLENLSKYSELILVTHNRETMSRASVLYGVTMNSEGVSKLLSIRLEDATAYAK